MEQAQERPIAGASQEFSSVGSPAWAMGQQASTGNAAFVDRVSRSADGGEVQAEPGQRFAQATAGGGGSVPFMGEMEAAFGQDFGGVSAHFGQAGPMADIGARAAASGETIAFAEASPSKELVAHELTHVVQSRRGGAGGGVQGKAVAPPSAVSAPGGASEREADQVAARIASGEQAGPIQAAPGGEVSRQTYKLGEVDSGPAPLDYEVPETTNKDAPGLVADNMNTMISTLVGFGGGLHEFSKVVESSTKKDTIPRDSVLIAMETVGKELGKHLLDNALSAFPVAGPILKALKDMIAGTYDAISTERKRAAGAAVSNALKDFFVTMNRVITGGQRALLREMEDQKAAAKKQVKSLDEKGQAEYIKRLLKVNAKLTALDEQRYTAKSIFSMIAAEWIRGSESPENSEDAYVEIIMGTDWTVKKAFLHAPRGDRLAEQLTQDAGGKFDITRFPVDRHIQWFPSESILGSLGARVTADNTITKVYSTSLNADALWEKYGQTFNDKIILDGLPKVVELDGSKTD